MQLTSVTRLAIKVAAMPSLPPSDAQSHSASSPVFRLVPLPASGAHCNSHDNNPTYHHSITEPSACPSRVTPQHTEDSTSAHHTPCRRPAHTDRTLGTRGLGQPGTALPHPNPTHVVASPINPFHIASADILLLRARGGETFLEPKRVCAISSRIKRSKANSIGAHRCMPHMRSDTAAAKAQNAACFQGCEDVGDRNMGGWAALGALLEVRAGSCGRQRGGFAPPQFVRLPASGLRSGQGSHPAPAPPGSIWTAGPEAPWLKRTGTPPDDAMTAVRRYYTAATIPYRTRPASHNSHNRTNNPLSCSPEAYLPVYPNVHLHIGSCHEPTDNTDEQHRRTSAQRYASATGVCLLHQRSMGSMESGSGGRKTRTANSCLMAPPPLT
ncbi:hypothetical protein PLESTB_001446400 [Pleodorina starrii]|uniref:Uncharacterized protein n=1 Tax=Pleodorina starrii TaxID=330485 RepID=A0A9W6F7W9_9CHLO|nr:hypothetical protein PLESTB_001446400 [Pleodorina starrii]